MGLCQSCLFLENRWVSLGKHSVRKGQWCVLNYAYLGNCVGFFFFVELHEKVLILRGFSISVYLFKVLMMKVLRLWGFFPTLRSMIACSSFWSTKGKVNLLAVVLVRSMLVWVALVYFLVNNLCLLFFSLFFWELQNNFQQIFFLALADSLTAGVQWNCALYKCLLPLDQER